ncbi:MAG: hypothetical protein AAFU77_08060 [Myxococcota bacterium]
MTLEDYHARLFDWHCESFFDFRNALMACELDYLGACFALAEDHQETSPRGSTNLSYYSYSHRVRGDSVNSSRLAFGSVARGRFLLPAMRNVLEARGLSTMPFEEDENCTFGGLGWDIASDHFKVYWLVHDVQHHLASGGAEFVGRPPACRPEGIESWTYRKNERFERKLYVQPRDGGAVLMYTDRRGVVEQQDVDGARALPINRTGMAILKAYADIGEAVDTVQITHFDDFTLYFP